MKDSKGFSASIGGASGAVPINSKSLIEGDGRFDKTRAQPDKGAGSIIGPYSAPNGLLKAGKPAVVNSGGPEPSVSRHKPRKS
jgi:hypothetical protein